ncbi:MAG: hypothetical protein E7632_09985 [Ruminococcaceae bacterium]|nr:hypothetical protein [Oscillospiraceae bacterium]
MKQIKLTTWLILSAMLLSTASCGGSAGEAKDTTTGASADDTTAVVGYDYEGLNYDGYTFKVLNYDDKWNCYVHLTFDEQTGETLDDAVYSRNLKVEDNLNFKLEEVKCGDVHETELAKMVMQSVMAGDQDYDAAYIQVQFSPSLLTESYLLNIRDIPNIQLDAEHWDGAINESVTINNVLFTASSPLHFMTLDMANVLLFNENMMDSLSLDYPYQLVRDGKWTLDKFQEYVSACTNLNGDSSFKFNDEGNAVYGIAGHHSLPYAFAYAAGHRLIARDGSDYTINLDSEKFYTTVEKIARFFNTTSGHVLCNADTSAPSSYLRTFRNARSGFITCELKSALELRDMQDTFGLLPMPKYDEAQEGYSSMMSAAAAWLTVPMVQEDIGRTGKILDALSYESWKSVLPIYYDVTVSQKGLRNEESIEMLEIIRNNMGVEFSDILGITTDYVYALNISIWNEKANPASLGATHRPKIEANLAEALEAFH